MPELRSYLEQLKFDTKLESKFVYKYLTNIRFVALLIIAVVLIGITSLNVLPRRLNPEVKIPIVTVQAVLPGASPEDIESLVTIPLEDEIEGMEGLTTITSTSQENVAIISLEFESSVDGEKAESDVKARVDKADLPEDATEPIVELLDFENQPVWRFAVVTHSSEASLFNFSRELSDKIEDIPAVKEVNSNGLDRQEVTIEINANKLQDYNINPLALTQQLEAELSSFPVGNVKVNKSNFPVSIEANTEEVQQIRDIQLNIEGNTIRLGDISNVNLKSEPSQAKTYLLKNGELTQVVVLSVYKRTNEDITITDQKIKEVVNTEIGKRSDTFEILSIEESAKDINDQLEELTSNFMQTIALVFITLLLFLGIRQALIVSLSIPLTFLISFVFMGAFGLSINFLTLFSLLLALGLLVDDAIVIVSAMTSYYKTGEFDAKQTGILVWRDFITPIWSTTITTVWAFVPLLLSTGIIGAFIKSIPIVVSSTLIASTSVAVLITLPLMILLLEPKIAARVKKLFAALILILVAYLGAQLIPASPIFVPTLTVFMVTVVVFVIVRKQLFVELENRGVNFTKIKTYWDQANKGLVDTTKIVEKYKSTIDSVISNKTNRRKTIVAVIVFSIFSYMLVPLGYVKNEFFPKSDFELIYINLELPTGTDLATTEQQAKEFIQTLKDEKYIDYTTLELGRIIDPNMGGGGAGENAAALSLRLIDESMRPSSIEIAQNLRDKYKGFSDMEVSVVELSGGPPAGADLQVKLLGDELQELDLLANQLKEKMQSIEGLNNVNRSVKTGVNKLVFVPNKAFMQQNDIDNRQVALWMRTYTNGFELGEIKIDDKTYDIELRTNLNTFRADELSKILIPTANGVLPLSSLGKFELKSNPTVISRENGQRTISVSAAAQQGYNLPELNAQVTQIVENELELPSGYTWQTGGVNEENEESVQAILLAMILSVILILVTMVLQLGSFRKAIIILLVIPLAISGVFIIFSITQTPLSFPALIGVLALFGIVVNNSIVIVEKINQNLFIGMDIRESIVDASANRLEPIFFSSLTTIIGLIPITISDPLWRGLGGAIISGLIFSGGIMLLFIPTVYYIMFSNENADPATN